jgi:hypothetical protein
MGELALVGETDAQGDLGTRTTLKINPFEGKHGANNQPDGIA